VKFTVGAFDECEVVIGQVRIDRVDGPFGGEVGVVVRGEGDGVGGIP